GSATTARALGHRNGKLTKPKLCHVLSAAGTESTPTRSSAPFCSAKSFPTSREIPLPRQAECTASVPVTKQREGPPAITYLKGMFAVNATRVPSGSRNTQPLGSLAFQFGFSFHQ